MKKYYLEDYLKFIISESPSIIQIISSYALLVYVIPIKYAYDSLTVFAVSLLISIYLGNQLRKYQEGLHDNKSFLAHSLYLLLTVILLGAFSAAIGGAILTSKH